MFKMISLKCPDCNAELSIEENRKLCFCQYCGAKIVIDDGATMHTYREIDDARIKEAEIAESIRLKEIEIEEKKHERILSIKIKASIILGLIGSVLLIISYITKSFDNKDSNVGMLGIIALLAIAGIWIFGIDNNK